MNILTVNNRVINLDKVSTVKVDETKGRIYFNMNFATQNSNGIYMQDFVYVKLSDETLEIISSVLNSNQGFITYDEHKWVNLTQVSSLKYDESEKRVIVNLCNPHTYTFPHGNKVLAEFIYIENTEPETFNNIVKFMENM